MHDSRERNRFGFQTLLDKASNWCRQRYFLKAIGVTKVINYPALTSLFSLARAAERVRFPAAGDITAMQLAKFALWCRCIQLHLSHNSFQFPDSPAFSVLHEKNSAF